MTDQSTTVTLTIDGIEVTVPQNTTILDAARQAGIDIPTICAHDATTAYGLCRICVVDVNGGRLLQPACVVQCQNGMAVDTGNERVQNSRRTILEMLNSAVDLSEAPAIQQYMTDYHADPERFLGAKRRTYPLYDDNPFYIRDYSKCVLCWRCMQVCAEDAQYIFALSIDSRGFNSHITTAFDITMPESTCVFCGQCVGVCPTNALKPKIQWGLEQGMTPDQIRQNNRGMRRRRKQD
jgi:predicted molibdopterin-dependent oxidoreductase YjgC